MSVKKTHSINYTKLKKLKFNQKILILFNEVNIKKFESDLRINEIPVTLSILKNIAKRSSIRASNLLEGILSTYETFSDITFDKDYVCKYDNEFEILGYKEAYDYIFNNYKDLSLDINLIKKLHSLIFNYRYKEQAGIFRVSNKLTKFHNKNMFSKDLYESKGIDHKLINDSMESLINEYYKVKDDVHELILIPSFILDFLNISPFIRGNGRVSRLLILFLLLKNNYNIVNYVSFDKAIEINQDIYFKGLNRSEIRYNTSSNSFLPFIEAFLNVLSKSYDELLHQINIKEEGKDNKKNKVNELIKRNHYAITKKEIGFMLPDVNLKTIESSLYELLKENKIKKLGTFKDAKYITNCL